MVNGSFQHKLCRELPKKNLDSLVKPGNDVFFTLFLMNRQLAMLIATQSLDRGIQNLLKTLDSRFHGNDTFLRICQFMDRHYL